MDSQVLIEKIISLSEEDQEDVMHFVESLTRRYSKSTSKDEKRQGFGSWSGIYMSRDFDNELEDFKEYMP